MDHNLRNLVKQCRMQYNDATSVFNDKAKATVIKEGSAFTRKILVDTVFSLRTVCDQLFDFTLKMAEEQSNSDLERISSKLNDVMNNRFNELAQQLKVSGNVVNPVSEVQEVQKEKHVIVVKEKHGSEKYNEQSWSTVVKGTLEDKLKDVPVNRSLLNKAGQGCLFFPNKKAQEQAQSVLEPLFHVTSSSMPLKNVLPKIKIFDINPNIYNDKQVLKQAILDKNPELNAYHEKGETLDIILINSQSNYAIIKVSPSMRKVLIKNGRIFLGMQSLRTRDHFQPLQCFACQCHGHKQGSEECRYHNMETPGNTCLYCSGDHRSKDCQHKTDKSKHVCVNCKNSDSNAHKVNANHTSTSLKCPFVIREINILIKRTTGIDEAEAKKLKI